jgi:hypothetical protein
MISFTNSGRQPQAVVTHVTGGTVAAGRDAAAAAVFVARSFRHADKIGMGAVRDDAQTVRA